MNSMRRIPTVEKNTVRIPGGIVAGFCRCESVCNILTHILQCPVQVCVLDIRFHNEKSFFIFSKREMSARRSSLEKNGEWGRRMTMIIIWRQQKGQAASSAYIIMEQTKQRLKRPSSRIFAF